ncbi:hypothetical protein [Rothia sp. ZJ932]|nr:hypothetical protein [Rothia sp. ZJ932]QRZ61385.1 hypothetical protein JR346_09185 [Rothia sp. ZJ932]
MGQRAYADLFTAYASFEKVFYPALIGLQVAMSVLAPQGWMGAIIASAA